METIGIILAAGKGSRMGLKDKNKVTLEIEPGKSLIQKGLDVLTPLTSKQLIVVGQLRESVFENLKNYDVDFAIQEEANGTGGAAQVAVNKIQELDYKPKNVVIGYGDHMYKYTEENLRKFIKTHENENADLTILTTTHEDPNYLGWGRIVKDENGKFVKIVEQKNATDVEKNINELNAGLYCFDYDFLVNNIQNLSDNNPQGEYLLTDMVEFAVEQELKVATSSMPFEEIGSGMNTPEHYSAEKN